MDNQSKIDTSINDIVLLLGQIKNKDPKVAVRQVDYIRSTCTRLLKQHFDYHEMKDFLFGNNFETTVLEAAKVHSPMMLTPSDENWMGNKAGKILSFSITKLQQYNQFQELIKQKIPKDAKEKEKNYPDRYGYLNFVEALIDAIPEDWMPNKADARDSTEWPLVPVEQGQPETFYDLNTFTADMANAVCFHLYGMQPPAMITLEDGTKFRRGPVTFGTIPANHKHEIMAGNVVLLVTSQMIEHELRYKLNNKKKSKNSLLKNGSRKKKKMDSNVDGTVNIKSISTNSSTLEELYRITSNLETPAGSDGDASATSSNSDSTNYAGTSSKSDSGNCAGTSSKSVSRNSTGTSSKSVSRNSTGTSNNNSDSDEDSSDSEYESSKKAFKALANSKTTMMSDDDDEMDDEMDDDELARLRRALDGRKVTKNMIFSNGGKTSPIDIHVVGDMKKLRVRLQARMAASGTQLQKLEPLGEKMAKVDQMIAEYSDLLK